MLLESPLGLGNFDGKISAALQEIEKENNVRILLACEVGWLLLHSVPSC